MKTTPETQRYLDAANAVRIVDRHGATNREQAAIAWLHEAGYYAGLTCDEERHLDAMVREACELPATSPEQSSVERGANHLRGPDGPER